MMKGHRDQSGFLLIEVLVMLTIVALAVSALVNLQLELYKGGALAAQRLEAISLTEQRMESLQAVIRAGMDWPESGNDYPDFSTLSDDAPGVMYKRTWSLSPASGAAFIDVTIVWQDNGDARHGVQLSSLAKPAAALDSALAIRQLEHIRLEAFIVD